MTHAEVEVEVEALERLTAERELLGTPVVYYPTPRPIKRAIPTYADGFHGIRRHRGLWHRLRIWAANR